MVTNRWLGLPIFALVMYLVYWIAMVGIGASATDFTNDNLFGDGFHLFNDGGYEEIAERYGELPETFIYLLSILSGAYGIFYIKKRSA